MNKTQIVLLTGATVATLGLLLLPRHSSKDAVTVADKSVAPSPNTPFTTNQAQGAPTGNNGAQPPAPSIAASTVEKPRQPDFKKLDAFQNWLARWKAAVDKERDDLLEEGIKLARERRPEFKALIVLDPKTALSRAVPRVIRQDLPAEIVKELERPVSAVGAYNVYLGAQIPGVGPPPGGSVVRYFEDPTTGISQQAYVYGDMEPVMTHKKIPLWGVAIDRSMAVAENAVRPLEIGEKIPAGTVVEATCPVSGITTEEVAKGEPITENTPAVEIGGKIITLCNSSHVTVLEDQFRTYVQAAGGGGSGYFVDNFPGTSSRSIGNLRCLYMRAAYPEEMTAPNTEEEAYADMSNNARFYQQSSYGKLIQTTTFTPLFTLAHTKKWYIDKDKEVDGLDRIQDDAQAIAKSLGYDPGQFDCIILRVNGGLRDGSSWGGGGNNVWLGWGGMNVINHEVGHSLGLGHAHSWDTTDGTPYGNGAINDYGNSFDVMGGGGGFAAHYNTTCKRALGWLPPAYVHTPTQNGTYRIHAYDQSQLEEGKRYALVVTKDSSRQYNIEYHNAYGGLLSDSALVLYGNNSLLDTTPGSSGGKADGGIAMGRTYSDWESDQHFTVVAKNTTSPPSLDVTYNRGPFPGNLPPSIASLGTSATTISAGGSVTFTATASDPNGDALAYHWQFSDGITGTNNAVFTRTFPAADQIVAMCTVSDMKGGTARMSVVINVGTHSKQLISGTVTSGGSPLAGVYISGGNKFCYSNSDGTYTLAGLASGSQTLSASYPGYTFTPSFTNPVNVTANVSGANWTAAGSGSFVTLTKTADATEGGANGNFRLTRTGDTSAALTVLVSQVGSTATKTTDYTFSPDSVSSAFTIPAGSTTLDIAVAAVNDTAAEGPETITMQLATAPGYWSAGSSAVVMTLNDNDTVLPQVAVRVPDPYATEGASGDAGTFTFTRTGSTTASLNLSIAWTGTATNGSDNITLPSTVTIPAGQSSVSLNVTPIDDSAIEGPETVIATLSANASYVIDTGATSATVTITDDDTPVVTVSVPDPIAMEEGLDSGIISINRSGNTAAPLTVYYGVYGSAMHGTDYARLSGQVTIPAGATGAPVVITPYDDGLSGPNKMVTLSLATFNNTYSIGSPYSGTVTIMNKATNPILVSARAGAVGTEDGANPTIIFHSVGKGSGNVTLNYTVSGTATAGSDYTALSGSISIPVNGSNDTTLSIPLISDTLAEPTETVVVTITPGTGYVANNDASATALIHDNDSGPERVMVSTYNQPLSEAGPGASNFYFSRTGTTGNLTVNYSVSGTATNGSDYATLSGTCVIPDTKPGVNVVVTPIDDAVAEGAETVTVTVLPGTGYGPDAPASATFEIADNDTSAVTVGFQQPMLITNEQAGPLGQYRDIPVVLSAASGNPITVTYVAGGGDASGDDVDWAFVDAANGNAVIPYGKLTFSPGTTSLNIRIRIKNDGMIESPESAVIALRSLVNTSLTPGKSTENIVIYDNVIPAIFVTEERWYNEAVYANNTWNATSPDFTNALLSFTPAQSVGDHYSRRLTGKIVAPATGVYTFWIASDDASRLYLSTDSTPANKTQIAGVSSWTDFQNWDAFASQKSANISLVAGQSYYMEVQHQEGGGGDHVSVAWQGPGFSRTPVTLSTPDDAPRTVRLLAQATTRFESDGSEPMLMVILDRPAGNTPITVDYTVGGTATAGSDYTLAPGTVTFAQGEQFKSLPLSILTDALGEEPETIIVSLTNPVGASLTTPISHTITLIDDSAPVVNTQLVTAASTQAAGTLITTATATAAPGRSIANWSIRSGNIGNAFAINAAGQVTLADPAILPNLSGVQLMVRAMDNTGSTGDGVINIICNPGAQPVVEQRWDGNFAYSSKDWTATPSYSGTLPTMTTAQNVADNYSRRLLGYLIPPVTGDYTFWIASDDDSILYLSPDCYEANKTPIASVSGWTGFQAWDNTGSQKSLTITLQAGKAYWMEVQHLEGSGGDAASVAWSGPGFAREVIPTSAFLPTVVGVSFLPPGAQNTVPEIYITSPAHDTNFAAGSNVTINASVLPNGQTISSVDFYRDSTLIGSATSAPYSVTYNNPAGGIATLTARANYGSTFATSRGVTIIFSSLGNGTWTNAAGGAWTLASNWSGAVIADGVDKTADFNTLNLTASSTVTLDGARTVGNLSFGDTTPSHNWILNTGSGGPLTLATTSGSPAILVNNQTTTLNAVLAGNQGFTKTGAGTLTLTGANSYSGGTIVTGGVLSIAADTALGATSGTLALNGGTLKITASGQTVNAARGVLLGASGGAIDTTSGGGNTTIASLISSTGPLTLKSTGNMSASGGGDSGQGIKLSNTNTFTGDVTITSGLVCYTGNGSFGAATNRIILNGGGLLDPNTNTALSRDIQVLAGGGTFRFWGSNNATWSSTITGSGNINRTDGGTLTLSGNLSGYTGTYANQGGNTTLTGTAAIIGGHWTLSAGTLTVNSTANQTLAGNMTGSGGAFTKTGSGTLTLTGTNTYTGVTTINGGTLIVNGSLTNTAMEVKSSAKLTVGSNLGGAVTVRSNGHLAFALAATPGAQPANTKTVGGALTFDAGSILDLSAAITSAAGDYDIVTAASISGTPGTVNLPPGVNGTVSVVGNSLRLTVTASGYAVWITNYNVGGKTGANDDADMDGISNAAEFVFGTAPNSPNPSPVQGQKIGDNFVVTFNRVDTSEAGNLQLYVEAGDTLQAWPLTFQVGATTDTPTAGVTITENSSAADTVTVTIPTNGAPRFFARLRVVVSP